MRTKIGAVENLRQQNYEYRPVNSRQRRAVSGRRAVERRGLRTEQREESWFMYRTITRKKTKKDRLVGLKMDRRRMRSSKTKEVGRMDNG